MISVLVFVLVTLIAPAIIMYFATTPAIAQIYNGDALAEKLEFCDTDISKSSNPAECFIARGYIIGVFDTLRVSGDLCPPFGVNGSRIFRIVQKYLNDSPETLTDPASLLAATALRKAFPCH